MTRLLENTLLLSLVLGGLSAQEIVVDWAGKQVVTCPATSAGRASISVRVKNVNDVLYTYDVDAKVTVIMPDDFKEITSAATSPSPEAATTGCTAHLANAKKYFDAASNDFAGDPSLTPTADSKGKYPSVSIGDTIASWNRFSAVGSNYANFLVELAAANKCDSNPNEYNQDEKTLLNELRLKRAILEQFGRKVNQTHEITKNVELQIGANHEIVVTVSEYFTDDSKTRQLTINGSKTFDKCSISADVLYLSAGPLFSAVPNRRYTKQQVYPILPVKDDKGNPVLGPDGKPLFQTSTNYYNALTVEGANHLHTVGAALLNYRFPWPARSWLSLSASAGPTFRFAGQDEKSSRLGFFTGVSLGMWRRLYITPGLHLGQFADFPAGLAPNSSVPSGYPDAQLDGVKRWTAKFGVAISFQTKSFSGLDIGLIKSGGSGGGGGQQKQTPAPNNAGGGNTPAPVVAQAAKLAAAKPPVDQGFTPVDAGAGATPAAGTKPKSGTKPDPVTKPATVVALGRPRFDGSACPADGSLPSYAITVNRAVLGVLWDQFVVGTDNTAGAGRRVADCQVQVPARIAPGYRIALIGADYRGAAELSAGDILTVRALLSLHSSAGSAMNMPDVVSKTGPSSGQLLIGPSSKQRHWSSCGGDVTLVFKVELSAKPSGQGSTLLGTMDTLDFDTRSEKHVIVEACGVN